MADQLTRDEIQFLYTRDPHRLDELRKQGLCDLALGIRTQDQIDLDNSVEAITNQLTEKDQTNGEA